MMNQSYDSSPPTRRKPLHVTGSMKVLYKLIRVFITFIYDWTTITYLGRVWQFFTVFI